MHQGSHHLDDFVEHDASYPDLWYKDELRIQVNDESKLRISLIKFLPVIGQSVFLYFSEVLAHI